MEYEIFEKLMTQTRGEIETLQELIRQIEENIANTQTELDGITTDYPELYNKWKEVWNE